MFSLKLPTDPSEDCLTLTVWTPVGNRTRRPVMLYSHGGGFSTRSAASSIQGGAQLARLYDVVVVATNHRLGLLGYLYLGDLGGPEYAGSGNQGMLDIVDGLKWISHNIEAFGRDPEQCHGLRRIQGRCEDFGYLRDALGRKAVQQGIDRNGPGIRVMALDSAAGTTRAVLAELGIATTQWRKLLEVPSAQLLDVQIKLASRLKSDLFADRKGIADAGPGGLGPVLDGKILPHYPFDPAPPAFSRNKPLLVGYNHDENDFFALASGDIAAFNLDEAGLK